MKKNIGKIYILETRDGNVLSVDPVRGGGGGGGLLGPNKLE